MGWLSVWLWRASGFSGKVGSHEVQRLDRDRGLEWEADRVVVGEPGAHRGEEHAGARRPTADLASHLLQSSVGKKPAADGSIFPTHWAGRPADPRNPARGAGAPAESVAMIIRNTRSALRSRRHAEPFELPGRHDIGNVLAVRDDRDRFTALRAANGLLRSLGSLMRTISGEAGRRLFAHMPRIRRNLTRSLRPRTQACL